MKRLMVLLFALTTLSAYSQPIKLGFKGGVNFIDIDMQQFNGSTAYETVKSEDKGLGYHAGAFARGSFGGFMIQTELVFTHLDQTLTATSSSPDEYEEFNVSFSRFDIPLLLGTDLGFFHAMVGPVASLNSVASRNIFDGSMQDATWGYQLGAGFDIGQITLDVKYEGAFTETANRISIGNQSFESDSRVSQFIISLGVDLL